MEAKLEVGLEAAKKELEVAEKKLEAAKKELEAAKKEREVAESRWEMARTQRDNHEATATEVQKLELQAAVSSRKTQFDEAAQAVAWAVKTVDMTLQSCSDASEAVQRALVSKYAINVQHCSDEHAQAELRSYVEVSTSLAGCKAYEKLRKCVKKIQAMKATTPPFIMFDESSGCGKTQALFALGVSTDKISSADEVLYFVLSSNGDDQLIYRNFTSASTALLKLLRLDLDTFREAYPENKFDAATIRLQSGFPYRVLEFFSKLIKAREGNQDPSLHPLIKQASLDMEAANLKGMTFNDFSKECPNFIGLFDEVPSIAFGRRHAQDKERATELQFLRSVVRAAKGVCVFSGTDSTSANMIANHGASRDELNIPWSLLWNRFPPMTLETLKVRYKNNPVKLDALLQSDWSGFLARMLEHEKGKYFNRPWFLMLVVECLDLVKFPKFSLLGLKALSEACFFHIVKAKQRHLEDFRAGQLKLLFAAYAQGSPSDWLLTSHFAHVQVTVPLKEAWLRHYSNRTRAPSPTKDPKHRGSSPMEDPMKDPKRRGSSPTKDPKRRGSSPMKDPKRRGSSPMKQTGLPYGHESKEEMHDLCIISRSDLGLLDGSPFTPRAMFPSVKEEPLLYLFCAHDPFDLKPHERNLLHEVFFNPLVPNAPFPAPRVTPDSSNPLALGSDGKDLEGMATAAMCIASHRSVHEFESSPVNFVKNLVIELTGNAEGWVLEDLANFATGLRVPYAAPPQRGSFSCDTFDIAELVRVKNEDRYDVQLERPKGKVAPYLDVSAECKDMQQTPTLRELLVRAPPQGTVPKWLRLIFCHRAAESPRVEQDVSHLMIATLKRLDRRVYIHKINLKDQASNPSKAEGMMLYVPLEELTPRVSVEAIDLSKIVEQGKAKKTKSED